MNKNSNSRVLDVSYHRLDEVCVVASAGDTIRIGELDALPTATDCIASKVACKELLLSMLQCREIGKSIGVQVQFCMDSGEYSDVLDLDGFLVILETMSDLCGINLILRDRHHNNTGNTPRVMEQGASLC